MPTLFRLRALSLIAVLLHGLGLCVAAANQASAAGAQPDTDAGA